MRLVFAIVGVPPITGTAPPLTRIVPAALRLIVIAFPLASPKVVWMRALGLKLLTTAMTVPFCIGGVRLGIDVPTGGGTASVAQVTELRATRHWRTSGRSDLVGEGSAALERTFRRA